MKVERFVGGFDFAVVFLLKRWKMGRLMGEDVAPLGGNGIKYVDSVSNSLVVMVNGSEAGGMFIALGCIHSKKLK